MTTLQLFQSVLEHVASSDNLDTENQRHGFASGVKNTLSLSEDSGACRIAHEFEGQLARYHYHSQNRNLLTLNLGKKNKNKER